MSALARSSSDSDRPALPPDITGAEVPAEVKRALRSLPESVAIPVSRHLVAAGRMLDVDPESAYRHTVAARSRAGRIALVREACGEAAYAAGRFKEALAEFQAARRLSGSPLYLPLIADCERALGRPERAISLAQDPEARRLDAAGCIEMRIVAAGARRDLGDVSAALRILDVPELHDRSVSLAGARLRYAYADTLLAAGSAEAAREWFYRAAAADRHDATDAAERLAELDGLSVVDLLQPDEPAVPGAVESDD
jgi:tetratricopeptide (TPR) repeat protein